MENAEATVCVAWKADQALCRLTSATGRDIPRPSLHTGLILRLCGGGSLNPKQGSGRIRRGDGCASSRLLFLRLWGWCSFCVPFRRPGGCGGPLQDDEATRNTAHASVVVVLQHIDTVNKGLRGNNTHI